MLSVLHILSSLNVGGAERITVELAKVQKEQNIDVHILTLGEESDFLVESVRGDGIPLMLSGRNKNRISRYIHLFKEVQQFNVIHLHSRGAFRFFAPILPLLKNTKVIYTRHGLLPDASISLKFIYFFLRPFINYVTFVTDSGLEVFTAHHNWRPNKLAVVRNGVFVPESKPRTPKYPVRFGSVGRMIPLKGQPKLLDAADALLNQNGRDASVDRTFKVLFFGSGPQEPLLRRQAQSLPEGIVEFHGEVPDIEEIYNNIDVLVVASESEGLSMVIMEAMARGIPVIATNVGGNSSLVHDHETGLLIEDQSSEAIYTAMLKTLSDLELITRLGESAKQLIKSDFSLVSTHEGYLQCYASEK